MDKQSLTIEQLLDLFAAEDFDLQEAIIKEASPFLDTTSNANKNKFITSRLKLLMESMAEVVLSGNNETGVNDAKFYQWFDPLTLKFDVIELHEKRTERRMYGMTTEGIEIDMTDSVMDDKEVTFSREKIQAVIEQNKLQRNPSVRLERCKWITTTIPALQLKVQDIKYPIDCEHFLYIPQFCYDYHADLNKVQSVMDDLLDPQSEYNKARSLKLELLARYNNLGYIMENGAIDGFEDQWTTKEIAPFRTVNYGYWNKIKPEERRDVHPELIRDMNELPSMMQHISGATSPVMGESEQEKSAKHYIAKLKQSERSYSYIFEHASHASKAVGEVAMKLIQKFMKMPQVIRITQDVDKPYDLAINQDIITIVNGAPIKKRFNDMSVGDFDIEIDESPYSATAKEMEYLKLADIFEMISKVDPDKAKEALPILIKASDSSFRQELLAVYDNKDKQNPMAQQQMMMIMLQEILAKLDAEGKQSEVEGIKLENQGKAMDNQAKLLEIQKKKAELVMQQQTNSSNVLKLLFQDKEPKNKVG